MRAPPWLPARPIPLLLAFSGAIAAGLTPTNARAADCAPANGLSTCIDADNLWLHPGGGPFFSLGSTTTAPSATASFGFALSYLSRPVGIRVASPDPDGTVVYALDNVVDASFLLSLGLTDRLEATIAAPVTLFQDGSGLSDVTGTQEALPRSVVRDTRIGLAFAIVPPPRTGPPGGFSLLSRLELGLPVGASDSFAGTGAVSGAGDLTGAYRFGRVLASVELGARLRRSSVLAGSDVASQLHGAIGAAVDILPGRWLTASAEAFALYTLAQQRDASGAERAALIPAEWIASVSSAPFLGGDVSLALGAGSSIPTADEAALTAPRYRVNLALRYAPSGRDEDADGVLDRDDRCPSVPEDRDGFQDDDGCPDPDNDGDRIPDAADRCRDEAETIDGFKDDDGCPDADDDGDGIPDDDDKCRNEPEDRDGFQDADGCPDPDNDNDGIEDKRDTCPNGPEDRDGFKDDDGCPDPDNDGDRIPDAADRCPTDPEDADGFQDDDGCSDPDNDEDGVLDKADACATTPETIDGINDQDGCPEPGARQLVRWAGDQVLFDGLARFPGGSAKMPAALEAQVRMMAQLIRGRAPLAAVVVEAYPDRKGDDSVRALELAAARAGAVKDTLVAAGVPADRITAAAGDTSAARAPGAPQIDIHATREKRTGAAQVAPGAAPTAPSQSKER